MIGQLLDRTISVAFPGWGLRRASARAALSTYAAAEKGRKNRDWNPRNRSADAAIIPDAKTLNPRARQMVHDSHIAKSIILSKVRNIAGRGITPIPVVSQPGPDGSEVELTYLNRELEKAFWAWSNDPSRCDVEGRRTFWQFQHLAISEKVTVGQVFIVWSYTQGLGFRLQAYETEQLDDTKQQHEGNEVRGGIEVNLDGKAVAYHFYLRNPADYLFRKSLEPVRIPAERVFHFFRPERVLQTHGVSELAPVLQRIRDVHRRDDAELMSAIMEACLGMAITRNPTMAIGASSTAVQGVGAESGALATTPGGMRKFDFAPGMIAELEPGEDVKFNAPTRPGGGYEPFTRQHLRAIGAGVDLSYEQVNRDFSQGTYSSQRQGLLEDRRAWQPEQDLLTDLFVAPAYRLWVRFAVLEKRIASLTPQLLASHYERYTEAEYVPDGHDWIDPEKEANAAGRALELRLTTRKEIIGRRGGRHLKVFDQLKAEKDAAAKLGITFPEDAAAAPGGPTGLPGAPGQPAIPTPGGPPAKPAAAGKPEGAEKPSAELRRYRQLKRQLARLDKGWAEASRIADQTMTGPMKHKAANAIAIFRADPTLTPEEAWHDAHNDPAGLRRGTLDCGTGAGGFKEGNTCGGSEGSVGETIGKFASRVADLPSNIYKAAKAKVTKTYGKLEKRYGRKMAIAIMAAGILGTAVPLPGTSVIAAAPFIAAAEIHRAISGSAKLSAEAEFPELSPEEIERLGAEFAAEIAGEQAELAAGDDCGTGAGGFKEGNTCATGGGGGGGDGGGKSDKSKPSSLLPQYAVDEARSRMETMQEDRGDFSGVNPVDNSDVVVPEFRAPEKAKSTPKPSATNPKPAGPKPVKQDVANALRSAMTPEAMRSTTDTIGPAIEAASRLTGSEINEIAQEFGIVGKHSKQEAIRILRDVLENQAEAFNRIETMDDDRKQ